jgi:hypothetical protein
MRANEACMQCANCLPAARRSRFPAAMFAARFDHHPPPSPAGAGSYRLHQIHIRRLQEPVPTKSHQIQIGDVRGADQPPNYTFTKPQSSTKQTALCQFPKQIIHLRPGRLFLSRPGNLSPHSSYI